MAGRDISKIFLESLNGAQRNWSAQFSGIMGR